LIWGVVGFSRRRNTAPLVNRKPLPRRTLLGMGVLFGVVAGSAFFALARLPVSLYTVLIYTYPAMVALGAMLFGEHLSSRGWIALALTMVGVVLTVPNLFSGLTGVDPLGVVFVLFNAVSYAAYILLSSRILRGHNQLMEASAWSITGSLLLAVGVALLRGVTIPGEKGWGGLLALATISTVIPAITFYAGMPKLGAARAAIVSMIEPVLTLIWAGLLLGERLEPVQVLGAAFIIGSVILVQARPMERKSAAKPVAVTTQEQPIGTPGN
jgi:drug/metabolite transporter (DMT)-like permease